MPLIQLLHRATGKHHSDVIRILDWSNEHQLPISVRKCSCIVLGNISVDNVQYSICKQPINIVREVCDLGVIVDPALKFNSHLQKLIHVHP